MKVTNAEWRRLRRTDYLKRRLEGEAYCSDECCGPWHDNPYPRPPRKGGGGYLDHIHVGSRLSVLDSPDFPLDEVVHISLAPGRALDAVDYIPYSRQKLEGGTQ